jgi:maltose alpha-D-glucosyltransferase/alpha-amylase
MNPSIPSPAHPVADPFWYKSGVIYEVHVRAFCDSDANGIGDFKGLRSKLGYLKELGVTALWLLPFYPSPLRDDGYDTADYFNVHEMYGTLDDFKEFLDEAHRLGLRVITELVLNHTSDQHPWFQRARRAAPGSRWREFYVWSDTTEKYQDARIIFKDIETSNWAYDNVAGQYYWHRFFSHQPDLNWENPEVYDEMVKVLDFWFDLGVDGLRLDAVPYLFEREGTSGENLPETHAVLKRLRKHVDDKYGDRMLLGEANQWPEDAVEYFGEGEGDECHMAFHFPLMPRLFMALRMEDRVPIVDILEQTPAIPSTSQWALFLRNHDELTLEMVTDEERDYMYRMYAHVNRARLNLGIRRRLAPLLGNDRRRIELMNAILLSLPGTPVLYYGDEIGMGENIYLGDRNGVRTPMQWSSDKNAGFSRANPQSLYLPIIYDPEYHYEACNVEAQSQNPHSLLWWMRRLLALRKRYRALGEGECEFLSPENHKILSYLLRFENETILVVANLSRFVQPVELDLSRFSGQVPVELFGRMKFPQIGGEDYFLTLSPHAFFWFIIEDPEATPGSAGSYSQIARPAAAPVRVAGDLSAIFSDRSRNPLEARLLSWLPRQTWYSAQDRDLRQVSVQRIVALPDSEIPAKLVFLEAVFGHGEHEIYSIPLAWVDGKAAEEMHTKNARGIVCDIHAGDSEGVLYDALSDPAFCDFLFEVIASTGKKSTGEGVLAGSQTPVFGEILGGDSLPDSYQTHLEQRNTSVGYGDGFMLKWFRRSVPGLNPEIELGGFLTDREFPHVGRLAGTLEFTPPGGGTFALAVLNEAISNGRNVWEHTRDAIGLYYERIIAETADGLTLPEPEDRWTFPVTVRPPQQLMETLGTYLDSARLLGERTAELHTGLAAETEDAAFAPENFTSHHVRGLFQSMRTLATHTFRKLRKRLPQLPPDVAELAREVLDRESEIVARFQALQEQRLHAKRIRCHGDLHLGQVLYNGKDFTFIDFEGDPSAQISERTIKRSPLRDVAGMLRSFHQAVWTGLADLVERGGLEAERQETLEPWARLFYRSVSSEFLRAYLEKVGTNETLAQSDKEVRVMLPAYILNESMSELERALAVRPDLIHIPLRGILGLLEILHPQSGGEPESGGTL